jgi:hypothetical protein
MHCKESDECLNRPIVTRVHVPQRTAEDKTGDEGEDEGEDADENEAAEPLRGGRHLPLRVLEARRQQQVVGDDDVKLERRHAAEAVRGRRQSGRRLAHRRDHSRNDSGTE